MKGRDGKGEQKEVGDKDEGEGQLETEGKGNGKRGRHEVNVK